MLTSGISLSLSQKARESFTHSTIFTKDKHTQRAHQFVLGYNKTIHVVVAGSFLHSYSNDIYLKLCAPLNNTCKMGKLALLSITYHDDGFDIDACKEQQNEMMHVVTLINSNQDSIV